MTTTEHGRTGRTLTKAMGIETRQHELFGMDLGEGPVRSALVFGVFVTLLWWGLLLLTIGPPSLDGGSHFGGLVVVFWFLPPMGLVTFGWQEDSKNPRRRNVTKWALQVRGVLSGDAPITNMGRTANRLDRLPLIERAGQRWGGGDPMTLIRPGQYRHAEERAAHRQPRTYKQDMPMRVQVRHVGTAYTADVMTREPRRLPTPPVPVTRRRRRRVEQHSS